MERDFQGAAAGGGLAARHPLLGAILEAAEDLHLVAHLADILVPWDDQQRLMVDGFTLVLGAIYHHVFAELLALGIRITSPY